MKIIATVFCYVLSILTAYSEDDRADVVYETPETIKAKYRSVFARKLQRADRVEIYIVSFDDLRDEDLFMSGEKHIKVAPYGQYTKIIRSRHLDAKETKDILIALAKQIAKPEHSGGALYHYPIHGIRIYRDNSLLHEGTFCWLCGNFGFSYDLGTDWLDTSSELETIFKRLLPVPKKELERFEKKYSSKKKKAAF